MSEPNTTNHHEHWTARFGIIQIIAIIFLLIAFDDSQEFEYYTLLRIVMFGTTTFIAYRAFSRKLTGWTWALSITALTYNPLVPMHLNRDLWAFVNLITIGVLIASIFKVRTRKQQDKVDLTDHDGPQLSWCQRNIPTLFPPTPVQRKQVASETESSLSATIPQAKPPKWRGRIGFWSLIAIGILTHFFSVISSSETPSDYASQYFASITMVFMFGCVGYYFVGIFKPSENYQLLGCAAGIALAIVTSFQVQNPVPAQASSQLSHERSNTAQESSTDEVEYPKYKFNSQPITEQNTPSPPPGFALDTSPEQTPTLRPWERRQQQRPITTNHPDKSEAIEFNDELVIQSLSEQERTALRKLDHRASQPQEIALLDEICQSGLLSPTLTPKAYAKAIELRFTHPDLVAARIVVETYSQPEKAIMFIQEVRARNPKHINMTPRELAQKIADHYPAYQELLSPLLPSEVNKP